MRILILSEDSREPGRGGGAESLLRDVTAGLRARGHEVSWWFGDEPLADRLSIYKPDICQVHTVHNRFGMQPVYYLQRHNIPYIWVLMDYWPFCQGRMLLKKQQSESCIAGIDAVCNGDCEEGKAPSSYLEAVNRSYVVALNPYTADIYRRNGIHVSAVIGCGIDTDYFKPNTEKRQCNKIVITSAWPQYRTKGLWVLEQAAAKLRVQFELVYNVSREQVRDALQTASIHIFPSTYEETWGLCLTEAMSSGLACIASDVCGPRTQITDGQNGILFSNRNVDELADKLKALLEDTEVQERLGDNARLWVEQNATLDIMAQKYERLYKAVLNG